MHAAVNIESAFDRVSEYWSPSVIGKVNDQYIKVAKVKGTLAWHQHDDEDEFFLVVRGKLTIQFREGAVTLGAGEFYVVPRGTQHNPVADEECWIVLIETVTTKHTGSVETPLTKSIADQLR